jgi:hypothetical protein
MTDALPAGVTEAFADHEAFEVDEGDTRLTTTRFEATVRAAEADGVGYRYTLTVRMPMLSSAVEGEAVAPAVEDGWFETLERRLADAPGVTRTVVELDSFDLAEEDGDAVATFEFVLGDAATAAAVAKSFAEYAEGTYLEGVVPGYDYGPPVSDLLGDARNTGGDEGSGPMPL